MYGVASHPSRFTVRALALAVCVGTLLPGRVLAQLPQRAVPAPPAQAAVRPAPVLLGPTRPLPPLVASNHPTPITNGPALPTPTPAPPPALYPPPQRPALPMVQLPPADTVATDDPKALEEKYLLPLLNQEIGLLQNFGPDHPDVREVRARIEMTQEWIKRQPRREAPQAPAAPAVHVELSQPAAQPAIHVDVASPTVQPAIHVAMPSPVVVPPPAPLPQVVIERAQEMPPPAPAVAPTPPSAPAANDTIVPVLVQLISILAALVVILLVQLVALLVILRRFAGKLTPQVRVEVVSAGTPATSAPGEVLAQRVYLDPPPRAPVETPMPTSLGPNYAEELAAEQDAAREQDAAVFKRIFEDNARLREQLGSM